MAGEGTSVLVIATSVAVVGAVAGVAFAYVDDGRVSWWGVLTAVIGLTLLSVVAFKRRKGLRMTKPQEPSSGSSSSLGSGA